MNIKLSDEVYHDLINQIGLMFGDAMTIPVVAGDYAKSVIRMVLEKVDESEASYGWGEPETANQNDERLLDIIARSIGRTTGTPNFSARSADVVRSIRNSDLSMPLPTRSPEMTMPKPDNIYEAQTVCSEIETDEDLIRALATQRKILKSDLAAARERIADLLAERNAAREALGKAREAADGQIAYWDAKQQPLMSPFERYTEEQQLAGRPTQEEVDAYEFGFAHGRFDEAHWWKGKLAAIDAALREPDEPNINYAE